MTKEEFLDNINNLVDECPRIWRRGLSVFNVVEALYGKIAKEVQLIDKVDCFYEDGNIDEFLDCVWKRLKNQDNT